ncbi:MAG: pyridoxine 5'-phosphate synthase [Sedimentisphaerales bacterium]|nr:pyridoxine 5'-phosphate synthase [Sedimentisphaerales bacterium]
MSQLNVNIDHVATLRQARLVEEPDPVWAAVECELGGAAGITMHLREDRRHIQPRDVRLVRQTAAVKVNLEMAMTEAMIRFAVQLKPDQVTLVPEKRRELTTEGGLDCVRQQRRLAAAVRRLRKAGIEVSAFIAPTADQAAAAADAGCQAVELHTGAYANARGPAAIARCLRALETGRDAAWQRNLIVHAGHGLNYRNIGPVAQIEALADFNIGHSIIARSVFVGLRQATRQMIELLGAYGGPSGIE